MQKSVLSRTESMCRGGSDPKHHGGLEGTASNSVCLAQGACMRRDWGSLYPLLGACTWLSH